MNTFFISIVHSYGYPMLWVTIFVAAVGLPIPGTLILLAAGAFAALGDFSLLFLIPIGITAATGGDNLGYVIGRRWGYRVLDWLTEKRRVRFVSPNAVARGRIYFKKRSGLAVFLTRFLFVALGGSINLLAGAERYPYRRFLLSDIGGQILGVLIPVGLGYTFAESWEAVGQLLGALSALLLALLIAIVLLVLLIRNLRKRQKADEDKKASQ